MDDSTHLIIGHVSRRELRQLFSKITVSSDLQWRNTPCWIWTAYTTKGGYGQLTWRGKPTRTHRVIYAWIIAPIPFGPPSQNGKLPEVDHLCRNRACCNPLHLDLVSRPENARRSPLTTAGRTHCKYGHEFTPENTYTTGPKRNQRACKQCQYNHNHERLFKERTIPEFMERRKRYSKKRRSSETYKAHQTAYMREYRRKKREVIDM